MSASRCTTHASKLWTLQRVVSGSSIQKLIFSIICCTIPYDRLWSRRSSRDLVRVQGTQEAVKDWTKVRWVMGCVDSVCQTRCQLWFSHVVEAIEQVDSGSDAKRQSKVGGK